MPEVHDDQSVSIHQLKLSQFLCVQDFEQSTCLFNILVEQKHTKLKAIAIHALGIQGKPMQYEYSCMQ